MKKYIAKFKSLSIYSLLISFMALSMTGCDDDDDGDNVEPVSIAYVSLYHASPDAPPVDIIMENGQINYYPLQYTRSSGYLNFYSGDRNMRVRPANDANVIIDTTFTFTEGAAYSLFYVNPLSDIEALLIQDEFEVPEEGNAAVRFIHLSPDAPAFDLVHAVDDGEAGPTTIADNQAYLEASDFMTVDSGSQSFQVMAEGSEEALLSIPDVNLASGGVYTIVVRGFHAPPGGNTNTLGAQILINY